MPSVFIDNQEYTFEGKVKALQFMIDNGIEIPYFCYHPALSIPTNCRMCLVEMGTPKINPQTKEVEKDDKGNPIILWGPKPVTSCNLDLTPGMHIKTHKTSQVIEKAQKGVLEFILINHPLDCPICDQAGECPLQINTYKYGPEGSRFELEKVHKPKRVKLGKNVMFDAERCINCTRCVRFTNEISGSEQLTVIQRGDHNYISTAPGQTFDDPYSMNTIDLCPVGALTSTDFRFKARVWEMNASPSICTGCAKGCNINVWLRNNQILRLTPRENLQVNQYWLCDEGRLDYAKYDLNRVSGAYIQGNPTTFEQAYSHVQKLLQKGNVLFVGSPYASLESNFALKKLAQQYQVNSIFYVPKVQIGWGDHLLRKDDRTPNTNGVKLLGFIETTVEKLKEFVQSGSYFTLYILEDDHTLQALVPYLNNIQVITHSYWNSQNFKPEVILPAATHLESHGTYINIDNLAQLTQPAKRIKQMDPETLMYMAKGRIDKAGTQFDKWYQDTFVYDVLPSWRMINAIFDFGFTSHKAIFEQMKKEIEALQHIQLKELKQNAVAMKSFVDWS
ncbi:MAG: 2Fe-2S iron-sulfur cluster-binding protein [Bacteroidia bacterium]|nr:2Fe-2S iron-sulfur cluster-binding protein [Bacteroidia bacterium]MDW8303021.1 2Fe-2S iron-sulfur cluster-binding protein [Bacteroidia bacterium]